MISSHVSTRKVQSVVGTEDPEWWRSAVVYQVYPRSFADSDGDGIGDLRGLIDRLDHIADLGIDVLWLSPIYRSPHDDNGYDISDYHEVDPAFGTLDDLDDLVGAVHDRGMHLILDLVVNHTSDEHAWFSESRQDRVNPKADWYIWRDPRAGAIGGTPGAEPNNWGSFFSGSAWEWVPERGQYYLHLFSRKQPDLNWDDPEVRRAIYAMMNWWLDRGIDGFRMDVINFISKDPALPDGRLTPTGYGDGMPFFAYGPHVHEYLAEMRREVFGHRSGHYFTVGEMPGVTPEQAARFTDGRTGQLDMVFQFEHVELDQDGSKWAYRPVTLADLKRSLGRWQEALATRGWNSLYWENHDQPRVVSRWGNDADHWYASATALATVLHLHRGTPFVYQGEELGMTNVSFTSIDDFRDIEAVSYFNTAVSQRGCDEEEVLSSLRRKARDNARAPMQWDAGEAAGFTSGEPWMPVNANHTWLNAAAQVNEQSSVYAFYRKLIGFRHAEPTIVHGDFRMLLPDDPVFYAFTRSTPDDSILVVANLSNQDADVDLPLAGWELLFSNLPTTGDSFVPWEARVYRARPQLRCAPMT